MAKLAHLAMNDAEQEQAAEVKPGESEHKYPPGLTMNIDKGTMQKAGMGEVDGHAHGDEVHGEIHGKIVGTHEHGVHLQVTHAALKKVGKSAAEKMYDRGSSKQFSGAGDGEGEGGY